MRKSFLRLKPVLRYRALQNSQRLTPSFFVAGTRKGGTTFLYRLLSAHPQVREPLLKELNYFQGNGTQDVELYRAYFPPAGMTKDGLPTITGESTPHYMFYPHGAKSLGKHFPDAKVILVLREPASRAFSEYCMNVNRGVETLSFTEAIAKEEERIGETWERWCEDPSLYPREIVDFAYKKRGLYLEQIQRLEQHFPKENILVLKSSELFKQTSETLERVEALLGICSWVPEKIVPENVGTSKAKCPPELHQCLREYFEPHDKELFDYLGWSGTW